MGAGPYNIHGRLVEGGDGFMYGTSASGGKYGYGVIFRVPMEGGNLEIAHDFDLAKGDGTAARFLTKGDDGSIYGTLREGGEFGLGALFRYGEPLLDPVVSVVQQETVLNRQTGLREQTIRVVNDTTATVPAYRLLIAGVPAGVTVANATEVRADGTVVVLVRQPLAPFSSFDLVLEYASANRQPVVIDPLIITEAVLVPPDDAAGEGTAAFEIERAVWLPEAGGLLLEFGSVPERLYAVEYSDDGVAWKTSPVSVRGAGNRTQWIDRGPPRTVSPPGAQPLRFYRVRALAD